VPVPLVKLTAVETLALGAAAVGLGFALRRIIPALARIHLPPAIAGGLVLAGILLGLHDRVANFEVDAAIRDVLMLGVFSLIGLGSSVDALRRGGRWVATLWLLSAVGAVFQNLVGGVASVALGLHPLVGSLAGAMSLAGGPATSLAFGPEYERAGVAGGTTIALASATYGIAVSAFVSAWVGARLLRRVEPRAAAAASAAAPAPGPGGSLLSHLLWLAVAMGLGTLLTTALANAGFKLPGYVGSLALAAVLRALDARFAFARFRDERVLELFQLALPLFIGCAMLTIKLWELAALAVPFVLLLIGQTAATALFCLASFRVLGRDYDAAIMASGFCGAMLGITPNAMASMDELTRRHVPSPKAFLVVPVVGGFLMDFSNSLILTGTLSAARWLPSSWFPPH
jgi:ESS family glutamate:Na+ symporter